VFVRLLAVPVLLNERHLYSAGLPIEILWRAAGVRRAGVQNIPERFRRHVRPIPCADGGVDILPVFRAEQVSELEEGPSEREGKPSAFLDGEGREETTPEDADVDAEGDVGRDTAAVCHTEDRGEDAAASGAVPSTKMELAPDMGEDVGRETAPSDAILLADAKPAPNMGTDASKDAPASGVDGALELNTDNGKGTALCVRAKQVSAPEGGPSEMEEEPSASSDKEEPEETAPEDADAKGNGGADAAAVRRREDGSGTEPAPDVNTDGGADVTDVGADVTDVGRDAAAPGADEAPELHTDDGTDPASCAVPFAEAVPDVNGDERPSGADGRPGLPAQVRGRVPTLRGTRLRCGPRRGADSVYGGIRGPRCRKGAGRRRGPRQDVGVGLNDLRCVPRGTRLRGGGRVLAPGP